jgi:hypothetical protein
LPRLDRENDAGAKGGALTLGVSWASGVRVPAPHPRRPREAMVDDLTIFVDLAPGLLMLTFGGSSVERLMMG